MIEFIIRNMAQHMAVEKPRVQIWRDEFDYFYPGGSQADDPIVIFVNGGQIVRVKDGPFDFVHVGGVDLSTNIGHNQANLLPYPGGQKFFVRR